MQKVGIKYQSINQSMYSKISCKLIKLHKILWSTKKKFNQWTKKAADWINFDISTLPLLSSISILVVLSTGQKDDLDDPLFSETLSVSLEENRGKLASLSDNKPLFVDMVERLISEEYLDGVFTWVKLGDSKKQIQFY